MKNILRKFILMFVFIVFMFSFNFSFAENFDNYGLNNSQLGATTLFGNADVPTVIAKVIQIIMGLSATIMLAVILYAGFIYLFSQGNPEKTKKAWALIKNASIGIIIIVTAYSLSQFIINNIKFIAQ